MAGGAFDVDVQDGGDRGEFVLRIGGEFALGGRCCKPCPCCCTIGGGSTGQPNATVTVAGSCYHKPGLCDCEGEHVFAGSMDEGDYCIWVWVYVSGASVFLIYCKSNEHFYAFIYNADPSEPYVHYGDQDECPCYEDNLGDDVTEDVTCNCDTGVISGTFDLVGVSGYTDCVGCTATVTLG